MGLTHKVTIFSDGDAISNSTTEILTYSALIPANTFVFNIGGIIDLTVRQNKVGTASSAYLRIYTNTSPTLSGALLIGNWFNSTITQYYEGLRTFSLNRNDIKYYPNTVTNRPSDDYFASTNLTEQTSFFDFSVDNYILVSVQLVTRTSDVLYGSFLNLVCYTTD
jgi:hypothetical protein